MGITLSEADCCKFSSPTSCAQDSFSKIIPLVFLNQVPETGKWDGKDFLHCFNWLFEKNIYISSHLKNSMESRTVLNLRRIFTV